MILTIRISNWILYIAFISLQMLSNGSGHVYLLSLCFCFADFPCTFSYSTTLNRKQKKKRSGCTKKDYPLTTLVEKPALKGGSIDMGSHA